MVWSIVRLMAARRMLKLSRWLLDVGGGIANDELGIRTDDAPIKASAKQSKADL
jgi:hypothetical protein